MLIRPKRKLKTLFIELKRNAYKIKMKLLNTKAKVQLELLVIDTMRS